MGREVLRNVVTGEMTEVDTGSKEYAEMRKETYEHEGAIKPVYEITSGSHADRVDSGDVGEEDMGYQNKPLKKAPAVRKEELVFGQRHNQLTPAEVEHGIKDHHQKHKELADMFGERSGAGTKLDVIDPDKREERGRQQAGRQSGGRRSRSAASSGGGES
jgi:hypothetical protein